MAEIRFEELIALVKEHPRYRAAWELGVPADEAFYIAFGDREANSVDSSTLETVGGHQLVLDRDKEGRVRGIEII